MADVNEQRPVKAPEPCPAVPDDVFVPGRCFKTPQDLKKNDKSCEAMTQEVYVFPASFAQERLWFLDKLEPGNSLYNVPFAARISGKLNVKTLEKSFAQLIARHEILRTVFSVDENDNLIQVVSLEPDFRLPVQDWGAVPEGSTAFVWQLRIVELARKHL